jgi:FMN reductase
MTSRSLDSAVKAQPPHPLRPLIVGLGGTFRKKSSTERVLDVALAGAERVGARVERFVSSRLALPLYNPESKSRLCESEELVSLLERCDGLIIASPSYHGSISGMLKNAIDYSEEMIGRGVPYLEDKAIGCIGCGAGWQGAVGALNTLRAISHALRGWPTPMGVAVNTSQALFASDGRCLDKQLSDQLELVGRQVVSFAWARQSFIDNAVHREETAMCERQSN